MTADNLKSYPTRDLASLAKKRGVRGWQTMRKEELIRALVRQGHTLPTKQSPPLAAARKVATKKPAKPSRRSASSASAPRSRPSNGQAKNGHQPKLASANSRPGNRAAKLAAAMPKRLAVSQAKSKLNGSAAPKSKPIARQASPAKLKLNSAKLNTAKLRAAKPNTAKPNTAKPNVAAKDSSLNNRNGSKDHSTGERTNGSHKVQVASKPKSPVVAKRLAAVRAKSERLKNLSSYRSPKAPNGFAKDRLVVMVRDPYWLHANWELTRQGVERAQAAMGQEWHVAKPVLRLIEVSNSGTTSSTERLVRNIEVHGGVNNWYVDLSDPPQSYRMDIGYLAPSGKFFMLAKSNVVTPPQAAASDSIDENWTEVAENFDKIYSMSGGYSENGAGELQELFEERLRRPMGSPMTTRFSSVLTGLRRKRDFSFVVDAELLVFGTTEPNARVTLHGDPVKVRPDGTFTVRFSLPNCRQVIPAVACSADGLEQRTIVLAIERNTKEMEPLVREASE